MFVVTADQRASTRRGDRVEELLTELRPWCTGHADAIVLPLERTVGDEVQVVLAEAAVAVDLALRLCRTGQWAVGLGAGAVHEPLAASARESSGPAFIHARAAVERAKGRGEPVPLVAVGERGEDAEAATGVLQLLGAVVRRRSRHGWEVADLTAEGVSRKEIAALLGISEQAVSQRARSAMLEEEGRARPVAAMLLEQAGGSAPRGEGGA